MSFKAEAFKVDFMPYSFAKKKLMTPGPVPLPDFVGEIFQNCHVHHRTKDFAEVLGRALANLKKVYQTKNHCFALPSTGTGAMEAAIVNSLCPGDDVLILRSGKFGDRWKKLSQAFSLQVEVLEFDWGSDIDCDQVQKELKKKNYKALLCQACETSTGALLPIKELGEICRETDTLFVVDGITALGVSQLPMDDWNVDILIGGSQKGFMLPTGMSFISLSEKAWKAGEKTTFPNYYWNLKSEKNSNIENKTRYSTPAHFILALDRVLNHILNEVGLEDYFKLIEARAQLFREAVNLDLFPKTPSPSLSCLAMPEEKGAQSVKQKLYDEGIVVMAGQDQLKDSVLRVGHMGEMTDEDLLTTARLINTHL